MPQIMIYKKLNFLGRIYTPGRRRQENLANLDQANYENSVSLFLIDYLIDSAGSAPNS